MVTMSTPIAVFQAILLLILVLATSLDGYWTRQKSVFNERTSDLAMDGSPETCAETGYGSDGWWIADLGEPKNIKGFKIKGSMAAHQILIGNNSNSYGRREPSLKNALCNFSLAIDATQTLDKPCRHDITGQYINVIVVDPASSGQLRLCDLKIVFA